MNEDKKEALCGGTTTNKSSQKSCIHILRKTTNVIELLQLTSL